MSFEGFKIQSLFFSTGTPSVGFYLQNAPLSTQIKKLMLVNEDLTDEFVAQQLDRFPLSPVKSDETFHFTDVVILIWLRSLSL